MVRGMLEIILTVLLSVTDSDAEALRSTAPAYLTLDKAKEHLAAARLAAAAYRVNADYALAIAWHESRYTVEAATLEPRDPRTGAPRWSCGVMTPKPMTNRSLCMENTRSALAGYMAGAEHMREWVDQCRGNLHCALRGYGGKAAPRFIQRARWIKWARERQNRS